MKLTKRTDPITVRMDGTGRPMKKAGKGLKKVRARKTLEQKYVELYPTKTTQPRPQYYIDEQQSLVQPFAYELVPSITTYGIADAPLVD